MKAALIGRTSSELWRYRLDRPVGGSGVANVDVIVVEIEDDQGLTAFGFSYVLAGAGDGAARAAQRILDAHVVGKISLHPEALHRQIRATFNRTGRGPLYVGLAAVDVAMWDLYAKRLNVPLGIAMGGAPRAVKVYGSGGFQAGQAPDVAVAAARNYIGRGASAVKPRVAGVPADRILIERVATAIGDRAFIAIDANEKCSVATADWLLRIAVEHEVLFVEEPLPAHDIAGYRSLASGARSSIATGEHLQGLDESAPFLSEGLCRIIQPDLAMMGGMTECLRVTRLAEALGLEVAPHFLPKLFVHLAAVSPNVTWLEDFPLLEPLLGSPPTFNKTGHLELPPVPGHGLSLTSGARESFKVTLN